MKNFFEELPPEQQRMHLEAMNIASEIISWLSVGDCASAREALDELVKQFGEELK
jgi:hypothetical protein